MASLLSMLRAGLSMTWISRVPKSVLCITDDVMCVEMVHDIACDRSAVHSPR